MTTDPNAASLSAYRRLLKQGGSPDQVVQAVTVCRNELPKSVSALLAKAGYDNAIYSAKRDEDLQRDFDTPGSSCVISGRGNRQLASLSAPSGTAQIISNAMLGADIATLQTEPDRALSPFEAAAFEVFCGYFVKALSFLCGRADLVIVKGEMAQADLSTHAETASIKLIIPVGEGAVGFSLTISHELLLQVPLPSAREKSAGKAMPEGALRRVQSPVTAKISVAKHAMADICRLHPGQTIMLGELSDALVTLSTGSRKLYECSIGQSGHNYAIRIERPYQALAAAVNAEPAGGKESQKS